MNIHLTPELEQFVQHKLQSGRYNSASEIVSEALRLLEQSDELRAIRLQVFRDRLDRGLAEAVSGQTADGEAFIQTLMAGLEAAPPKSSSM